MKFSKNYFKEKEPIPFLLKCNEANSRWIKQVLKNNRYLLKKYRIKQKTQIEQLRDQGVKITASGMSRFRKGHYKTCSLTYLQIFAEFWFISLPELMMIDYQVSDELRGNKG
jgi:hypothetical protein